MEDRLIGPEIRTARLVLQPFATDDAEELLAVFREPSVRKYLLDDERVSRNWLETEIAWSETGFAESGHGLWCLRATPAGPIVGFAGFRPFFDPPELQLLYGLLPGHRGEGLATEASMALIRYAFEELGFDRVRAATDAPNEASVRVLERLGMRRIRETEDGMYGTIFFEIDADAWRERSGASA
jgi:ribosomal-protein-alanine N-acetyltransferase